MSSRSDRATARASQHAFVDGIVSAASDNDPTTVATLAVTGASIVYALNWLLLLVIPMLMVVQSIGTQVAGIAREGMMAAIRRRYGVVVATVALISLIAVNIVTYAADLEAGAAALGLLTHTQYTPWMIPLSVFVALLLTLGTFAKIRGVLALLPLAFLAYVAALFVVHPDWHAMAAGFVPHIEGSSNFVSAIIAMLGTTLTAYSYFWQTVEIAKDAPPRRSIRTIALASLPGTVLTGLILFAILCVTAATLGVHHHDVQTAEDAARALQPIAGAWASIIFSIGLLGSSLLALPVLAAGTAVAVATTYRWGGSLDKQPPNAKRFYGALYGLIVLATALAFAGVQPIKLLFIASIAGGIATPITLGLLVALGRDRRTMGERVISVPLATSGWAIVAITIAASLALLRWH